MCSHSRTGAFASARKLELTTGMQAAGSVSQAASFDLPDLTAIPASRGALNGHFNSVTITGVNFASYLSSARVKIGGSYSPTVTWTSGTLAWRKLRASCAWLCAGPREIPTHDGPAGRQLSVGILCILLSSYCTVLKEITH